VQQDEPAVDEVPGAFGYEVGGEVVEEHLEAGVRR